MVHLQQVNRLFYKRVAEWMRTIYRSPKIRLSYIACPNTRSNGVFVFPTQAMIDEMRGELHHLVGFENNKQCGQGGCFNFILSNGRRSQQKGTYYTHMLPHDSRIRSVDIFHSKCLIVGFQFFDLQLRLIFEIGNTNSGFETVVLADNEVIIGVVARLCEQAIYTDFQFQIAGNR